VKKVAGTVALDEKVIGFSGLAVTDSFLDFFEFGGNSEWLQQPRQVVLTRELSDKLFGDKLDVTGSTLEVSGVGPCLVTGVLEELPRSHIDFEMLISMTSYPQPTAASSWLTEDNRYVHYLKIADEATVTAVNGYLASLNAQLPEEAKLLNQFKLQPVGDINLGELVNDELSTTIPWFVAVFFEVLGLIVIVSASFNFIGLSLARSLKRAREVGIRKILGSAKRQIVAQFLIETQLLALLSLIVAIAILSFLLPAFNDLKVLRDIDGQITVDFVSNLSVYISFVGFAIAIGLIAGIYPAFYMSKFNSQAALKGAKEGGKQPFQLIRNGLLLLQFTFSILFVMTTLVLSRQADKFVQTEYGYDHRQLAFVSLEGYDAEQLTTELSDESSVKNQTFSSALPSLTGIWKVSANKDDIIEDQTFEMISGDEQFLSTLGISIIAGNDFSELGSQSKSEGVIINETTLETLQFDQPSDAIGQWINVKLDRGTEQSSKMKVIGVCPDFRHGFAMSDIKGLMLTYQPESWEYAVLNLGNGDRENAERQLGQVLSSVNPNIPIDIQWFDLTLSDAYDEFYDIAHIFSFVSLLAIIIANLGQYGAIVQVISNRVKEIGIRKVLGSSYLGLMLLLSKGFVIIMSIALVVGGITGVWMNGLWLGKIGEAVTIDTSLVVMSVLITALSAIITVVWNVYKASMMNPVESIRAGN
ncbi:MAG: FtsX-like permease family protein, partial [Bacteroidota bacterium]